MEGRYEFKKWYQDEIKKDSQNISLNSAQKIYQNLDDDD